MRVPALTLAWLALLVAPLYSQSTEWQQCLPFPSFAQELAAMGFESQSNMRVELRQIRFTGAIRLSKPLQDQIAAALMKTEFTADVGDRDSWMSELSERVRDGWQRHGFYKVHVNGIQSRVLATFPSRRLVAATARVEEGPQYRLGGLEFRNGKLFLAERLRSAFPLGDGDIFATDKIREGLENLRNLYGSVGYINFVPVPNEHIDESKKLIWLDIDLDEGGQFRVGEIHILGLDSASSEKAAIEHLGLKEGEVYTASLLERLHENLKNTFGGRLAPGERRISMSTHTVNLTIDLREPKKITCPDWASLYEDDWR